jgi:recombination protein RecR
MNPIEKLTAAFERFPGIGPRQARRFVQFLLSQNSAYRTDLAREIQALGTQTASCKKCFRWFVKNENSTLCAICTQTSRDQGILFVLEKDTDIDNVERSGYKGLYFVLGGVVPLAEEFPERFIRAKELLKRVESDTGAGVLKEIILGLSATAEGDHTRLIVQEKLLSVVEGKNIKLSSLGRGLSTGSELEYADPDTIASALSSRNSSV